MRPKTDPPVVAFLTGPTAVGKSAVALALAERRGWELLSIDSRQIYRRLEIGTAKPTPEDRRRVPHHLIDLLDAEQAASAGWFRHRYLEAAADLARRGARGFAAGGTGLYWEACTRGLHRLPASVPEVRAELEAIAEREGLSAVYDRLAALDPEGAARLDRHNRHRVLRALELVRLTGRPLAEIYAGAREGDPSAAPVVSPPVVVLTLPRPEIWTRIEGRCEAMLAAGLLGEIRALLDSGVAPDAPGLRTVGYREFLPHLLDGESLALCVDRFVANTRQYAKRQETWFRNRLGDRTEVAIRAGEPAEAVADRVLEALKG